MAGLPVVTVANGGLAVTPVASGGLPVTEAANGMGLAVTIVSGGAAGMGVTYEILVPTITLSGTSFMYENTAIGTTIGTLSVLFPNGTYTFSKTSDPDSAFTLTGTTLKNSFLWDYETKTSHPVTIQATNGVDAPLSRTFTVLVGDIDEVAPVILTSATQTIAENSAFSITLTADKPVTWSKTGGADSALFTLAGATLSLPAQDFEDATHSPAYIVQVTATSTAFSGAVTNKTITVNVTNVVDTMPGPAAGTLVWSSAATVNPPVFTLTMAADADMTIGDTAHFQQSTAADFSTGVVNYTDVVDSTEDAANTLTFSGGGAWPTGVPLYVRERTERPGHDPSAWTNIVSQTLGSSLVTAPPTTALYGQWNGYNAFAETSGVPATRLTTDGAAIGSWADMSGHGNHAYQPNSAKKPIFKTSILNSLPAGRWDGTDDGLIVAAGPTGNSFSIYAVASRSGLGVNVMPIVSQVDGSINPRYAIFNDGSGNIYACNGGAGASTPMSATTYHLVAANYNNTAPYPTQIQVDNNAVVTANATGNGNVGGALEIGSLSSFSKAWPGDIVEVLVYTAVHDFSTGDGLQARRYLNDKYALGFIGGGGPLPPFTITSPATESINENVALAHALTASGPASWDIVGPGADDFVNFSITTFGDGTGVLTWQGHGGVRDYEAPLDVDGDNVYHVTVKALSQADGTTLVNQNIVITVLNVAEGGVFAITTPATASINEGLPLSILLTATDPAEWSIVAPGPDDFFNFSITTPGDGTGILTWQGSGRIRDFENPMDGDGNNVYQVTIQANKTADTSVVVTLAMSITVLNVLDPT